MTLVRKSTSYELLGVTEDACDKEIQSAYRKLSLTCHPDRHPDDPDAADKFEKLNAAKELLLDPLKRSELDREIKKENELERRYAEEDGKRRKLRETLEERETNAGQADARAAKASAGEVARVKLVKTDFAARIAAKEAELSERQQKLATSAQEVYENVGEARLRITWRSGAPSGTLESRTHSVRDALVEFDIRSMELSEAGGMVQLGSREDALRAVLNCRERRHQLPFRVTLATTEKKTEPISELLGGKGVAGGGPFESRGAAKPAKAGVGGFKSWESNTLDDLRKLAAAKKAAKAKVL